MSRTQIKTNDIEKALKAFQIRLPYHKITINSPLSKGAYDLSVDGIIVLSGTKKEIYQFLTSYNKVYDIINHIYTN